MRHLQSQLFDKSLPFFFFFFFFFLRRPFHFNATIKFDICNAWVIGVTIGLIPFNLWLVKDSMDACIHDDLYLSDKVTNEGYVARFMVSSHTHIYEIWIRLVFHQNSKACKDGDSQSKYLICGGLCFACPNFCFSYRSQKAFNKGFFQLGAC